jgi:membrane-associated protease RseP (regulator of RpoE activity)
MYAMRRSTRFPATWRRTVSATLATGALVGGALFGLVRFDSVAFGQSAENRAEGERNSTTDTNSTTDKNTKIDEAAARANAAVENAGEKAANLAEKAAGAVERAAAKVEGAVERGTAVVDRRIEQAVEKVDNAAANIEQKVDAALLPPAAVAEIRAKIILDVEDLDRSVARLADTAKNDETLKNRLDTVRKKLAGVKDDLRGTVNETADQVHAQLRRVDEKLEVVRDDLDAIAKQSTGKVAEVAKNLSTRVDLLLVYLHPRLTAAVIKLDETAERAADAAKGAVNIAAKAVAEGLEVDPGTASATTKNGAAHRGRFGVSVQAAGGGVTISHVYPGSPAARAGLQPGDQLLKLNGAPIATVDQLRTGLNSAAQGNGRAVFEINRGGRLFTVEADFGSAAATATRGTRPM